MKSVEEVIQYIDSFVMHALERPHMYASSPQALEEKLAILDQLREFILEVGEQYGPLSYAAFLSQKGYGVRMFTTKHLVGRVLSSEEKNLFKELSDFWMEYLVSRK